MECTTKIYFGTGILEEAIRKSAEKLKGNILIIVTGNSVKKYGYLGNLVKYLKDIETVKKVDIYDSISSNPRLEDVMGAVKIGIDAQTDIVIGLGGGSAIDAAKAAAIGISQKADLGSMEEYLLNEKALEKEVLPIAAIPTTAGTGSELSKAAILSSEKYQIKSGIRGSRLQPQLAIVDSKLTWTLPEKITMETGFDVLAHAIESYVSVKSNFFTEMLSEKAVEIVGRCLRMLKKDLNNHDAREEMSYASMIMGLNLANAGTCLPHRMQYPIGAFADTSHASGLAALYPSWMQYEHEANREKIQHVMKLLKIQSSDNNIKKSFASFLDELGIQYRLGTFGIKQSDVNHLVSQVTGNLTNDKLYQSENILFKIMKSSI